MTNSINVGGVSIPLITNYNEINPCQFGRGVDKRGTIDSKYSLTVHSPMVDRGPSFSWIWNEYRPHTVKEAVAVEKKLFSEYNVGVYTRADEHTGGSRFVSGPATSWLAGSVKTGKSIRKVNHYYNGSNTYVQSITDKPWFIIDDVADLHIYGFDIIRDICMVEHKGTKFFIFHDQFAGPIVRVIGSEKRCALFHDILLNMLRERWMNNTRLLNSIQYATDFIGMYNEVVPVFECRDADWMKDKSNMLSKLKHFSYKGVDYVYEADVEVNETACDALRDLV